jgi:hypothetical protein
VPRWTYRELIEADSPTGFFEHVIYGKYPRI